jgi:signal transduction histidine kinase
METEVASAGLPAGTADAGGALGSAGVSEVIADVAHTLRNHFHRLYYWMDVVGEQALDDEARAALDAAGGAVRSIERLTAGAMALSRDLDLSPISMEATEVADAIAQSLRRQGAEVALECGAAAGARVAIDASHVSRTIEIIGGRLGANPDRSVAVGRGGGRSTRAG